MPNDPIESLEELAAALMPCFIPDYHQGIAITTRSKNNLIATWWFDRADDKPRRWEVSIRFPGNLLVRYSGLDHEAKVRAKAYVREVVLRFVGQLESLEESEVKNPASYVCELDDRMFD